MNATVTDSRGATLKVLYSEQPRKAGGCFVEIRLWETGSGEKIELIAEYGQMDLTGELVTQCQVMPFYMTVREVLEAIAR